MLSRTKIARDIKAKRFRPLRLESVYFKQPVMRKYDRPLMCTW